jgi:hypothetical protein
MGLQGSIYHVFFRSKREKISCGYCLITKGLVIQEHPINLVCQQQANCGGGTNVYSMGLGGCICQISLVLIRRNICFGCHQ